MITIDELDDRIAELDAVAASDHSALHAGLGALELDYKAFDLVEADPTGTAYRAWQLELYARISKREYDLSNEAVGFDVEAAARQPYPYSSGDRATIASHLKMIGFIGEHFDVPPGARVLELGAGWGNLALMLAQCGYQVSAIDLEPRFVELIGLRARKEQLPIETWVGDFLQPSHYDHRWGAIVFNACFHHCDDHQTLLDLLVTRTAPDVRLIFAGESVYPYYPWPWGMNLTGQAVYCIRKFGWLELAFSDTYFLRELMRRGIYAKRSVACFEPNLSVIVGRKFANTVGVPIHLSDITLLPVDQNTFQHEDDPNVPGRFTRELSTLALHDPMIERLVLSLVNILPVDKTVTLRHGEQVQTVTLQPGKQADLSVNDYDGGTCTIETEVHQPKALGLNTDARFLGIYLASITVDRLRPGGRAAAR